MRKRRNAGYSILDAGCRGISTAYCLLLIGLWFLVSGFWLPGNELKVKINNINTLEGSLYIALYDCAEDYMDTEKAAFKDMIPVDETEEMVIFHNIPEGEYAVAVFQDLNGNGELDVRGMGIPKEPFGFSNNARGKLGPAKYKNAKFTFSGDMEIDINLVITKKEN